MNNIETIEKLLKDELAATETYQQVLDKLRKDAGLGKTESLMPIFDDHKEAVSSLQAQILQMGGTPADGSGVWGEWANIIQGGANLLGKTAALMALRAGEKSGEEDYEKSLLDLELPSDVRALIETKLLPAQQAHIRALDRLLDSIPA